MVQGVIFHDLGKVQPRLEVREVVDPREVFEPGYLHGFEDIAKVMEEIAEVEAAHEERYRKLLERLKEGTLFTRSTPIKWRCRNCGYIHEGTEPPEVCPACAHPRAFYEPAAENY